MKKFFFFLISLLIGIALFFWILNTVGWQEVRKILFNFSGRNSLIILFLTMLIWLVGLWKWKFVLNSQGCNYPFMGLLQIAFASNAVTYLLSPTALFGGEGFRVYALRKKFSAPWDKNLAAVIIEKLLSASMALIFLILGVLSFLFLNQSISRNLAIISIVIIGGLTMILATFYFKSFKKESIFKLIFRFFGKEMKNGTVTEGVEKEIFNFFEFNKKTMWQGMAIAFLRYFLIFVRCWILIFFLKRETSILIALAVMFFLYLAYSFPLPAGMGALDTAQAFAFGTFNLGQATGITFSFILRGAEIIISLIGIIFLIKLGIEIFSGNIKNFFQKITSNQKNGGNQ
ncbi:MAG: lysylphosphatidylglycerol synthase transmembrane domain-containing protein [Candidatus Pacebacteria bacterium]|nr:lysylphosphatidylglycerol synthase transmembrane domain-containing protein [Candidatus Paceibacterota bacterium]